MMTWDAYFLGLAAQVAGKSRCHSRQVGAILVRENAILSTGYNGPPRGVTHCTAPCPRRRLNFKSGEGLHLCPAVHAEANAVAQAARMGTSVWGSTMYVHGAGVMPCKACAGILVNAGIIEVVSQTLDEYDPVATALFFEGGVLLRRQV